MNVVIDAIPQEFCSEKRFIVWKHELVDGEPKKVPYRADFSRRASSTKPDDWVGFAQAVELVELGRADGIGYALPERVVTLVDLDDCVNDGVLHPAAAAIVAKLDSFSEWSQSKQGVHVLVQARLNGSRSQTKQTPWGGKLEVWDNRRFVYLTGDLIHGTPATLEHHQDELDDVVAEFLPAPTSTPPRPPTPIDVLDEELLELARAAKNGAEFEALWRGAWEGRYASHSEADLAFAGKLAFWTGRDPARIDRMFRNSGLMRDKWLRDDYRERTIQTAIDATPNVYGERTRGQKSVESVAQETASVAEAGGDGLTDSALRESVRPSPAPPRDRQESSTDPDPESVADPSVPLETFVEDRDDSAAEALIGHEKGAVLTKAGLIFLLAKTGAGKTTNAVDLILHAAAGVDYPPFTFSRPLRVLLIENEGPREAFRQKLEARLSHWTHPHKTVRLWDDKQRWGSMRISEADERARLACVLAMHDIDLVVADSLTRFGVKGNGTPEETREFVDKLNEVGFQRDRAFLLLHHPITRPDPSLDEIEQMTGAWGPHVDAILFLKKLGDNRARLSFPKTRWARGEVPAVLLGFDTETEAFTYIGEEADEERDYVAEISGLLEDGKWRTAKEIAAPKKKRGIGANVDTVKTVLEEHPDVFDSLTGDEAAALGRSSQATLWQLRPGEDEVGE